MQRAKKILAFGAILLLIASLLTPLYHPSKAHADGSSQGTPIAISTCQGLQDINNDLTATYTLSNNIDCSGGLVTIGEDGGGNIINNFTGRFYGQGHTISNLSVPLFGRIDHSIVANLYLSSNLTTTISGKTIGTLANSMASGIVTDVHASGTITLSLFQAVAGGLIGTTTEATIVRSSADMNVQVSQTQVQYGGLAQSATYDVIRDSYAVTTMTITSGNNIYQTGGLATYAYGGSVTNFYASGSINNPSLVQRAAGLVYYAEGVSPQVTNSFSTFQGIGLCSVAQNCSGLIAYPVAAQNWSTDYFDQTAAGTSLCDRFGNNTSCHVVNTDGTQGAYFHNNSTNGPLSSWDFSSVWNITAGLPTLRNLPTVPSPTPDPVTQLSASISSETSIDLTWALPANTGSAASLAEAVYYQKAGDTSWQRAPSIDILSYSSPSSNFLGTSLTVSDLDPATNYNFEVVLYNRDGYYSVASTSGVTATPGFAVISTCQQLQDVNNDPYGTFELGQNIDCSDSVNWNAGQGFVPIGCNADNGVITPFKGTFEGNNYTINNIYIDGGSQCGGRAIFASTEDALIQDFTITNPTIAGVYNSYGKAVLAYLDNGSTFTNIHVNGDFIGNDRIIFAGLIGQANGSVATTVSRVSFVGNITGDLTISAGFGGIVAVTVAPVHISDSYVRANLTDTGAETVVNYIGGIVAYDVGDVQITRSYAALNYDATGVIFDNPTVLGGLVGAVGGQTPSITNSFARTQVQGYSADTSLFGGLVSFISPSDPDLIAIPADYSSNYFDADLIGTSQCVGTYPGDNYATTRYGICNALSGQPNYFFNNSTNPPLSSWDFDNIWQTTNGLPVFGRKASTTVTAIPPSRLVPRRPAVVKPAAVVLAVPAVSPLKSRPIIAPATTSTTIPPAPPQGVIAQLKQLVSHVPTVVLVGFPYLLFALLGLVALALLIEMIRQAKRLKQINLLLEEQRSVAEKRDTFWHLAANYLRAPITLLVGGADLLALSKVETAEAQQLTGLSERLQTKVAGIMEKIEHSHTLQDIKPPRIEKPRRVWLSVGFLLPVLIVAALMVLTNYVAHAWRNLQISTINLAVQALAFLLVAFALYWALSAFGVVNRRRRNAEKLLNQQGQALDSARLNLMQETATDLDSDVSHLQLLLAKLSGAPQAKPIMQEGASRLRHLVDSFQLLISAQNHRLGGLSPVGAGTSLDRALKEALSELEPEIAAKNLTIDTPHKLGLRVPGSPALNSQVLSSVLANAVAFSPSGSTIRLDVGQTDSGTSLMIADHGPGITSVQQAHLFEPFTKADGQTGLQLDHDGLGINLYLNRQIMDHLGGQITVHSTEGQGTLVELQWPQAASPVSNPGAVVQPVV